MPTQPQIFRSLASAVMLLLNDLSPDEDFDQLSHLFTTEGRLALNYEAQLMPMVVGPDGTYAVPGISIEYGEEDPAFREAMFCPVRICLAREISQDSEGGSSLEREQEHLAQLALKLRPMLFVDKSCPLYDFVEDEVTIAIAPGRIDWHDERLGTDPPRTRFTGVFEPGGWMRMETRFRVFYRL